MWKTIALTLLLQSQPNWLEIGYAQDRCSAQGCLAEATAPRLPLQVVEKQNKQQTSVFYAEDRFFLEYDLRKKIRDFLVKHPDQQRFVVTGFTDGCGDHQYNKELSRKRANEVARYIMAGGKWNKWIRAIGYWKPRGAKVFVATTGYIPHKARLNYISPAGGTEIHFALWALLDRIPPGKTLLIISDFRSTVPLTMRERQRIEQKAAQKGVKITHIKL
jgi:hypothetical protein